MSDCCCSCSTNETSKSTCPVNGKDYKLVSIKTIQYHIKQPWKWVSKDQEYFFCDAPEYEVVYFGEDQSCIKQSELRSSVGVKERKVNSYLISVYSYRKKLVTRITQRTDYNHFNP